MNLIVLAVNSFALLRREDSSWSDARRPLWILKTRFDNCWFIIFGVLIVLDSK